MRGDIVLVTCYNRTESMTRNNALKKFLDCMRNSEGAEHERYETIYFQLVDGKTEVSDMVDWRR